MTGENGGRLPVFQIKPMLAVAARPFDSPDFIYEVKWDGYRCLAYLDRKTVLQSRNLLDITPAFPELAGLHRWVGMQPAVLDGEIIIPGEEGRPSFSRLQARGRLADPLKIRQAALQTPAVFVAFDLLYCRGENIMPQPLHWRKGLLQEAVQPGDNLVISSFIETHGTTFFAACARQGLEGVMAKAKESPYLPGRRSSHWRKIRHIRQGEFIIVGYEPGTGGRRLGALILGTYRQGRLVYRGKVGTGFDREEERRLLAELKKLKAVPPPFGEPVPGLTRPRWVEPRLLCTVEYLEQTPDGCLRHPVYRGLRWDREPGE
ncbi:non-homologous end-joining DNA ligase [Neomoorella humiferrea]|uniref:non-homologous end-joining DNA ligase n=1 Tax=Neomoorella humiferrea TaxID=676965 RepID=UPI003D946257